MSEAFVWPNLEERARLGAEALAALRESAQQEGRAAGYAEGLEAGRAAAQAELDRMRVQLRDALNAVDGDVTRFAELQATQLAALLHGLCRRVLGYELTTNLEAFENILSQALARLDGDAGAAEAYLNPDDHAVIAPAYHGAVVLHADAQVPPASISLRLPTQAADFQPLALIDELFEDIRNEPTD